MAHFSSTPPANDEPHARRNARYGLVLFIIYSVLYGTFMYLNAFAPWQLQETTFGGVNGAVLFGLGLIATAFLLALTYAWLCRNRERPAAGNTEEAS